MSGFMRAVQNIYRRPALELLVFIMSTEKVWPKRDLLTATGSTRMGYIFSAGLSMFSICSSFLNVVTGNEVAYYGVPAVLSIVMISALILGCAWGNKEKRANWILKIARTCDSGLVEPILRAARFEGDGCVAAVLEAMPDGVLRDVNKKVLAGVLVSKNRDVRIAALKRIG